MNEPQYYWNQITALDKCINILWSADCFPDIVQRLREERIKYMGWYVDVTGHIFNGERTKEIC